MDQGFIVIEGNIGAGKTTLAKMIAVDLDAKFIPEEYIENPFLPKFYENPDKYSFPLELSFLADRYNQLNNEMRDRDLFKPFIVSDYYFTKSLIFAQNTLSNDEYRLYRKIFNIIYTSMPKPDLYVYLYLNVENLMKNIEKRGRDYERSITADYLEKIQKGYFDYMKTHQDTHNFLVIDTNTVDFVENKQDYIRIKDIILNSDYSKGISRVIM